jgi:hypothetical protein
MLLPVLALAGLLGLVAGLAVYLFMQQKQQTSGAGDASTADATAAAPRVRRLLPVLVALSASLAACWFWTQRGTPCALCTWQHAGLIMTALKMFTASVVALVSATGQRNQQNVQVQLWCSSCVGLSMRSLEMPLPEHYITGLNTCFALSSPTCTLFMLTCVAEGGACRA